MAADAPGLGARSDDYGELLSGLLSTLEQIRDRIITAAAAYERGWVDRGMEDVLPRMRSSPPPRGQHLRAVRG
jgi:hypothetical protein